MFICYFVHVCYCENNKLWMITVLLPSLECLLFLMLIPVTSFIDAITGWLLLLRDSSFIHGTQGISIISYETETSNIIIVRTKIFLEHFRKKISALPFSVSKPFSSCLSMNPVYSKSRKVQRIRFFIWFQCLWEVWSAWVLIMNLQLPGVIVFHWVYGWRHLRNLKTWHHFPKL